MNPIKNSSVDFSLIMPAFNEEGNIGPLVERIEKVMSGISCSYEIIVVNNGSNDSTPFVLEKLLKTYPQLVAITLTRNFGYDGAIIAGLENSRGKKIIPVPHATSKIGPEHEAISVEYNSCSLL